MTAMFDALLLTPSGMLILIVYVGSVQVDAWAIRRLESARAKVSE